MHELLFDQSDLSRANLKEIAKQINLKDLEQFNSCLDKDQYADRVANDMAAGQAVGISGTPGFIIGYYNPDNGSIEGELISGAQPANVLSQPLKSTFRAVNTAHYMDNGVHIPSRTSNHSPATPGCFYSGVRTPGVKRNPAD